MATRPDRDQPARSSLVAGTGADGARLLPALADLQRQLDVLGDDLAAADRALVRWEGRARERFRHHVVDDLARLAGLVDDLRRERAVLVDVDPVTDPVVDPGSGWST